MIQRIRLATNFGFSFLLSLTFILLITNPFNVGPVLITGFLFPAILLTFTGRIVDNYKNYLNAKIWALCLASLLLFIFLWTGTTHLLSFSLILSFWAGHLMYHESDHEQDESHWPLIMGALLALFICLAFIKASGSFDLLLKTVLFLLFLVFSLLAALNFERTKIAITIGPRLSKKGTFSDLKTLCLLQGVSFILAGYFLGSISQWSKPDWPWFVTAMAFGVFITRWNMPLLGFKRYLALIYLILLGFFLFKPSELEPFEQTIFILFYLTLFVSERWATTTLYKRSLPFAYAGFFTGILVLFSCVGMTMGVYAVGYVQSHTIPIVLLITLMILNQTIYPERASKEAKNEPIRETVWGNAWLSSEQDAPILSISTWMKYLQRTLCEVFFGKIRVRGLENLANLNGALFISNHPNTFFDPLLVSALMPFKIMFLAKSTLWRIPVLGSFLDHFGLIPVQRAMDVPYGERRKNLKSINKSSELLNQGTHILIFPEGVSQNGLTLKPIKTGAARIVFGALEASNWETNIPIIPIGIDYEKPAIFRSSVTIRIGTPISLMERQEDFKQTPKQQVRDVTRNLSSALIQLLPHLNDPEKEHLVQNITELYGSQVCQFMKTDDVNEARLGIAKAVNHYCETDPTSVIKFQERLKTYTDSKQHLELKADHPPITLRNITAYIQAVFSPHMLGLILHWLPYSITGKLVAFMPLDYVWHATAKLITGLIIYPLYYFILNLLFTSFFGSLIGYILLAATALTGIMALGAFNRYDFLFQPLETLWNAFWRQDAEDDLTLMKTQLLQDLERFREAFAFHVEEMEN